MIWPTQALPYWKMPVRRVPRDHRYPTRAEWADQFVGEWKNNYELSDLIRPDPRKHRYSEAEIDEMLARRLPTDNNKGTDDDHNR